MLYSSKTSNHIFFESFYTRDMFINRYNINANKTSVLHIGRDEYFTPSKSISSEQYSIILSKKFILSVSHLYPYKNIETLIHAFKRLRVIDNDLILVLAGSTDNIKYFNELKDLVNQYNLKDSIFFLVNFTNLGLPVDPDVERRINKSGCRSYSAFFDKTFNFSSSNTNLGLYIFSNSSLVFLGNSGSNKATT